MTRTSLLTTFLAAGAVAALAAPPMDFTGDGTSDLLWRHGGSGAVYVMPMSGGRPAPGALLWTEADPAWRILAAADFDGDGRADLLWRNAGTGMLYVQLLDGASVKAGGVLATEPDLTWQVAAVADFTGDGRADLLWRNTASGAVYLMPVQGLQAQPGGVVWTEPDPAWQIVGAGDFRRTGRSAVLWRNTGTGMAYEIDLEGGAVTGGRALLTEPDLAWRIVGLADFDGDGATDLLWRHTGTGQVYVMPVDASGARAGGIVWTEADPAWQIEAVGDFDGDGKGDFLFRHAPSGMLFLVRTRGTALLSGAVIYQEPDLLWRLQATGTLPTLTPPSVTYAVGPHTFHVGTAIAPLGPVNAGGAATTWTVAPALPAGLALDPGTGVLSGTPAAASPQAAYQVTAANAVGSGTATLSLAVVQAGPVLTSQPRDATVNAGATATFQVSATGTGPLAYQWYRNGAALAGATAATCTTAATTPADSGAVFTVGVTDADRATTLSQGATLTVVSSGPALTAQPQGQTVVAGRSATYAVTASGTGLSYQWLRNGAPLPGATASTCTVATSTIQDACTLQAVVSTATGATASSEAYLHVLAAPTAAPTYTLIRMPADGLQKVYDLINGARSTIDLTMYEFKSDATALAALQAAAARGVKVRVILDTNGEKSNNTPVYNALAATSNVAVHWAWTAYNYTHQKTLTVDGTRSAILTGNFTGAYYATGRDYAVILDDPYDLAAIQTTFEADFNSAALTPPTGTDLVWSPTNSRSALTALIGGATQSLLLEQLEMADTGMQTALLAALGRGVAVTLVQENTSHSYDTALSALKAAGARIAVYTSSTGYYIHAKAILADFGLPSARLFVGSENFSANSLQNNRELGIIFSDPACMTAFHDAALADFTGGALF